MDRAPRIQRALGDSAGYVPYPVIICHVFRHLATPLFMHDEQLIAFVPRE